jgi:D-beta-D-heptose 7-phosphate kinase/D-beta-D-heptose 1-phosphate adenosyltransferase
MGTNRHPDEKIVSRDVLLDRYRRPREQKIVFTNGCFDVLHRGHVEYLFQARALGDLLVVGINTDASVERLKGPGRPVVTQDDRAHVLAGLESVDAVTLFHEDTPRALIRALQPDVLVKGGDYEPDQIVGREEVEGAGGEVVLIPYIHGRSTTQILGRIRGDTAAGPGRADS